jgi:NAD(P)H-nitrite reductase large subunit
MCPVCGAGTDDFKEHQALFSDFSQSPPSQIIIVGNGAAGMEAARILREKYDPLHITVFTREPFHFYSRIHLSTFIGENSTPDKIRIFPVNWYEEQRISVNLDTAVVALEPGKKQIRDNRGNKHSYDKLILATGASPFIPPISGVESDGIFTLRNMQDALIIRTYAEKRHTAVVVGGGILGIEAANSLNRLGLEVTVVEVADHLLPRQMDRDGAAVLLSILEKRGIRVRLSTTVQSFVGKPTVNAVKLSDGTHLPAEMVLISAGIKPETRLAQEAGINVNYGIIVNERMETSARDIYAAGDVTEFKGQMWGIWPAAMDQGIVAGMAALGLPISYHGTTPLHILKVSGIELTAVGQKYSQSAQEEELIHMNPHGESYLKLIHNSQILLGAVVLGIPGIGFRLEKLIKNQTPIRGILNGLREGRWEVLKQKNKIKDER